MDFTISIVKLSREAKIHYQNDNAKKMIRSDNMAKPEVSIKNINSVESPKYVLVVN